MLIPRPSRVRAVLRVVALAAVVAVFWWQVRMLGNIRIDDAYITFSFSRNLATGHGPVYSHGLRVEGYSNFLWMLLVAAPLAVRPSLDPYLVARVLTVPFAILLGWAVRSLIGSASRTGRASQGRRADGLLPEVLSWVALVFLALDTDLVVAAICGLETLPFVALLVAGFALYLRGRAGSELSRALTVPCFVAVALMRIDGFAPLLFILAWELASAVAGRRFQLGAFVRWAGPAVLLYAFWFAWRYEYYGLILPTTYYAKALIPKVLPGRGLEYARDFWVSTGLFAVAPFALVALWRRARQAAPILLFVLADTAYVIRVGGDWMPFFRFFAPIVPFLSVLLMWGIVEAARLPRPARRGGWRRAAVAVVLGVSSAAVAWMGRRLDGHSLETPVEKDKMAIVAILAPVIENNFLVGARLLNHVVPPGKRLVSDYAGVMAYFTDAEVIDMWGLANKQIALRGTTEGVNPIWGRTCPPCYATLGPDFFHVPAVLTPTAYRDQKAVVDAVWQSRAIGKYVDFRQFVAGRVTDRKIGRAMFFLEKRRPGAVFRERRPAPDIVVEYPFEPAPPAGAGG